MDTSDHARHALVVEDDPFYAKILREILEDMGFLVDVASALAGVQQFLGRPFELITLDLRLPDADGTKALTAMRALFPKSVIMVVSGHMNDAQAVELLRLGADHCSLKPSNPNDFIRDVNRTLEMKNPAKALARMEQRTEGLK